LRAGDAVSNWGMAMNPVSVLKRNETRTKASDRTSRRQGEAQSPCELISLLSFLEADNKRLRQAALDLSRETAALRQVLKGLEGCMPTAQVTPKARRLPRRLRCGSRNQRPDLPFGC
jgi:hypothetical protein